MALNILDTLAHELEEQAAITRNFIPLIPEDKYDWAPHAKSMKMVNLASHIAELSSWVTLALKSDGLDFATSPYEPKTISGNQDLMALLEKDLAEALNSLKQANLESLTNPWVLRQGEHVLGTWDRMGVIRMSLNQIVHHRAQLGVYFRLLDIPVPQSFGPSADSQGF